ncbi:RNA polymerase sigma factor SigJ [Terrabacter sp. GCM10028922]|jgi:RNA polymerase sigma-70 factor, ECF subfamily|uniref:RNA polymerase sigma factor SigJ n=1 Tax=Terrabacter sp. GCM10028922 TaxID=3273428 RepID=UPI0036126055
MTSSAVDDPSGTSIDSAVDAFTAARPRLFGIAYRMLGSVAEAEDIVQEAWLRWQRTDRSVVHNPAGFLTTVTTRLALNTADSARARREQYVGPWLPEPVDTSGDPSLGAEKAEALEAAVLVLLEKLRPEHRAAYVLREAFDYSYDEIAEILATTPPNARQMVSRARKHVQSSRKEPVEPAEHRTLLEAFLAAARDGDLERLEQVLSAEVVSTSDGAGIAPRAARRPVAGRDNVARFVAGWADWWTDTTLTWLETNGQASVLVKRGDAALALLSISSSTSGIDQLLWVMAPDKLTHVPG